MYSAKARIASRMSRIVIGRAALGSAPIPSAGSPGGRGRSWSPMTDGGIGMRGASPELEVYFA